MPIREYTATEKRILHLLRDGEAHRRDELKRCIYDELVTNAAVNMHISRLRKKLKPKGQDIVPRLVNRRVFYQHVIKLTPSWTE